MSENVSEWERRGDMCFILPPFFFFTSRIRKSNLQALFRFRSTDVVDFRFDKEYGGEAYHFFPFSCL
jgi:hypothetical protein